MSPFNWKSWIVAISAAGAVSLPLAGSAQSLDQVLKAQQGRTRLAQESQERVDSVVKQTRSLDDQYKGALKEIDGLKVYNTLLGLQVENQVAKMADLRESIDQVEVINRQIVPIMMKMISGLEQFVDLDVPFLLEERKERVAKLHELMERDDVTVAEKFRKVTEAYQIEMDYGSTIEPYKDTVNIDGGTREVDFLRVGRVSPFQAIRSAAGTTGPPAHPCRVKGADERRLYPHPYRAGGKPCHAISRVAGNRGRDLKLYRGRHCRAGGHRNGSEPERREHRRPTPAYNSGTPAGRNQLHRHRPRW